jgi:L-ascorbate metabolism protein UlaG (beta-lactamase superfamily)
LTDPWYNKPAFGSWLPSFAPYIHPTHLASLGERLTILVSHGHDDHLDGRLLGIFDKKTKIVTADFTAPSVVNRLNKLGFENTSTVFENESKINGLMISSYIAEYFSHDDATYLIRNDDGTVIHANDNWHEFESGHELLIKERVSCYSRNSVLLFNQTNSASGHPLNYRNFSDEKKFQFYVQK